MASRRLRPLVLDRIRARRVHPTDARGRTHPLSGPGSAKTADAVHGPRHGKPQPASAAFAPPYLVAGDQCVAQTANILLFLSERHQLGPRDEGSRFFAHQLELTIVDAVEEAHDVHHPVAGSLYYKEQKAEALRAAEAFRAHRMPKFLGYFEAILAEAAGPGCSGTARTHCRPVAVPARRGPELRLPAAYGDACARAPAGDGAARPRSRPAGARRLLRQRPPPRVQRGRHLPPLSGARRAMSDDLFLQTLLPTTHDLGGFKVHRTLPHRERTTIGPFIFFDQMGPAQLAARQRHRRAAAPAYQPRHRHLSVRRRDRPSRFARHLRDDRAGRGQSDDRRAAASPIASARPPQLRPDGPELSGIQTWLALPDAPRRRSIRPSSMSRRTSCRSSTAAAPARGS